MERTKIIDDLMFEADLETFMKFDPDTPKEEHERRLREFNAQRIARTTNEGTHPPARQELHSNLNSTPAAIPPPASGGSSTPASKGRSVRRRSS